LAVYVESRNRSSWSSNHTDIECWTHITDTTMLSTTSVAL